MPNESSALFFNAWLQRACKAVALLFCVSLATHAGDINNTELYQTHALGREPITPIPHIADLNPLKVALGEQLFADPVLSKGNAMSCATCHILVIGGMDQQQFSYGVSGEPLPVNTPTIFNIRFNSHYNWNGRFENINDQNDRVISFTLQTSWEDIAKKLNESDNYRQAFNAVYNTNIVRPHDIRDALVAYQKSLITPNSRFDRYLKGELNAINTVEKQGYDRFKRLGCVACHQGVNIGGNVFQRFGLFEEYFSNRGNITTVDFGRFTITGRERDRFVFRVPSLRNIAITAPYFHDGSAATLEEAVKTMARYQLGHTPTAEDVRLIVAFLRTLTGEHNGASLEH